jgi:hypothetical protein
MISGRIGYKVSVVAVFSVLAIFLFPTVHGPYSAIHGPVTALRAVHAAASLRLAILAAAVTVSSVFRVSSLEMLSSFELFGSEFRAVPPSESTILRC